MKPMPCLPCLQVWIWTRFRINYIYLFELDPRSVRSYLTIFNDAAVDSILFLLITLLYFKVHAPLRLTRHQSAAVPALLHAHPL